MLQNLPEIEGLDAGRLKLKTPTFSRPLTLYQNARGRVQILKGGINHSRTSLSVHHCRWNSGLSASWSDLAERQMSGLFILDAPHLLDDVDHDGRTI